MLLDYLFENSDSSMAPCKSKFRFFNMAPCKRPPVQYLMRFRNRSIKPCSKYRISMTVKSSFFFLKIHFMVTFQGCLFSDRKPKWFPPLPFQFRFFQDCCESCMAIFHFKVYQIKLIISLYICLHHISTTNKENNNKGIESLPQIQFL